jgi:Flp pilus assembly protein TadD
MKTHTFLNIRLLCYCIAGITTIVFSGCAHKRPRTHNDLLQYGVKLAEAGYWQEAAAQWKLVLREDPDNPAALNNLGVALEYFENFDDAEDYFEKAHNIRPDDKLIQRNRKALQNRLDAHRFQETSSDE